MLPFVMLPRPLQESNVVGKGGTAGFLGKAYDPYTLYPDGDDMDMAKMDKIKVDDLQLRPEVFATRLERRAKLRDTINAGMPDDRQGRRRLQPQRVLRPGSEPGRLGPRPRSVQPRPRAGRHARPVRPQHVRPELLAGPAAGRGRHAGGRGRSGPRSPTPTTTRGTTTSA